MGLRVDAKFSDEWDYETFLKTICWSLSQNRRLHFKLAFAVWNLGSFMFLLWTQRRTPKTFFKVSWILLGDMIYNTVSSKKRKSCKISKRRILYISNIYLLYFHVKLHIHRFYKNEVLMFYSGVMADIGALEELRKTAISYVISARM